MDVKIKFDKRKFISQAEDVADTVKERSFLWELTFELNFKLNKYNKLRSNKIQVFKIFILVYYSILKLRKIGFGNIIRSKYFSNSNSNFYLLKVSNYI